MNQFGDICTDGSQAVLVLGHDLEAGKGLLDLWPPATSSGAGPLIVSLWFFRQSSLTSAPCRVLASVLSLFHFY